MSWQDGLALLIVAIAALALLRRVLPAGMMRFGSRRDGDGSARTAPPAGGCGGCASGASCFKTRSKDHPSVIQRREPLLTDRHRYAEPVPSPAKARRAENHET